LKVTAIQSPVIVLRQSRGDCAWDRVLLGTVWLASTLLSAFSMTEAHSRESRVPEKKSLYASHREFTAGRNADCRAQREAELARPSGANASTKRQTDARERINCCSTKAPSQELISCAVIVPISAWIAAACRRRICNRIRTDRRPLVMSSARLYGVRRSLSESNAQKFARSWIYMRNGPR